MNEDWKELVKYLPIGWQEKARELGAFTRRRGIENEEELLTLNLLYLTLGGSYQATSTMMRLTAEININKNATRNRIAGSWRWLRWMGQELYAQRGYTITKPEWLGDKEVVLEDASDIALGGSKSSNYRLHYAFSLFEFTCREMELTTVKEGERLSRHKMSANDIIIADRIYCTIAGIEHTLGNQASFVLRYRSKAFHLYDNTGVGIELLPKLRGLESLQSTEVNCYYKLPGGGLKPIRVIAMKKDPQAIEETKRKMARKASRKQEPAPSKETVELNEYIVLTTNLSYAKERVLELYRARWQIEQVFYRLKSLFSFGEVPSKNPDTAKAWFYGKLLVAALSEAILPPSAFSPSRRTANDNTPPKESLE